MRKIALFDMDGTLADYDGQLLKDLNKIASPSEPMILDVHVAEPHIEARRHVITSQSGWWLKLPRFKLGWDVLEECNSLGFSNVILTKGPSTKFHAWSEKLEWCTKELGKKIDGVTITHDKGLVYGSVLTDDFPEYIESWLKFRPRGTVIMPAHPFNLGFTHSNVVRYDGTNLSEVVARLSEQKNRQH